jgi:hypothetical protein
MNPFNGIESVPNELGPPHGFKCVNPFNGIESLHLHRL